MYCARKALCFASPFEICSFENVRATHGQRDVLSLYHPLPGLQMTIPERQLHPKSSTYWILRLRHGHMIAQIAHLNTALMAASRRPPASSDGHAPSAGNSRVVSSNIAQVARPSMGRKCPDRSPRPTTACVHCIFGMPFISKAND